MSIDKDGIGEAYQDVRSDSTDTIWAAFSYEDDKTITVCGKGTDYNDFLSLCTDDIRLFGYVRFETGDEMSRRAKFAFITWIGRNLATLKKAKMSTDKAFVKQVCAQYGVELLAEAIEDLEYSKVEDELSKAGGARYGVGK